ncbi:MAG: hypothetical protein DHS20C18_29950 [Saprospiraceae bacterium]|nr:MAG: hypothetical protein DHS20C18_29950 [Saprospiraceae bacterium]
MNRLQFESSPYLLQHANNPVNWFAWKPEAFEKAKQEDKPILVSIGYSTCHWCHVMERESFENEQTAAFMNKHFINIKVDREERPDVDQIYMEACQIISGAGGWPLNCFLTPDGRPFYAGTYYPPEAAYNRPSWPQVLQNMAGAFQQKREVIEEQADKLVNIIRGSDETFVNTVVGSEATNTSFTPVEMQAIFKNMQSRFDRREGGFGGAPKFPSSMTLQFLLDFHALTGNQEALEHLEFSLKKMIRGGIYDQIGGGFARYATDDAWLVPHFEKMLYDNALLISLMANTYKLTKDPLYKRTIEETLAFIAREMTSPEGGFYAALDADSEGVEGKFYVWDKAEIDEILSGDADLFNSFYQVTEQGNWEGKNILWRPQSEEAFALSEGDIGLSKLLERFTRNKKRLLEARSKRIRPGLDDKILLNWNALQCSAYAQAASALGNKDYQKIAQHNLQFILDKFRKGENLYFYHTYKEGHAQYDAFLDDYAFLIAAILDVYELDFDPARIKIAVQLTNHVLAQFFDEQSQLFYFTGQAQSDIILRRKDLYDSALPSGNSTMVYNLFRLGILTDQESYRQLAHSMLTGLKGAVEKYPTSFSRWAGAMLMEAFPPEELAVLGEQALPFAAQLNAHYLPNRVIMASMQASDEYPLLAGRYQENDTLIYICKNYACQLPVKTVEAALDTIRT